MFDDEAIRKPPCKTTGKQTACRRSSMGEDRSRYLNKRHQVSVLIIDSNDSEFHSPLPMMLYVVVFRSSGNASPVVEHYEHFLAGLHLAGATWGGWRWGYLFSRDFFSERCCQSQSERALDEDVVGS